MAPAMMTVRDLPVAGERLCGLTWLHGLLWFSDAGLEQILAIDPESGREVTRLECPAVRTDLTHLGDFLVQIAGPGKDLRVIDSRSGRVEAVLPNPRPSAELCGIEVGGDLVWMGFRSPALVECRRWSDLSLVSSAPVADAVAGLTIAGSFVAFGNYPGGSIHIFDPVAQRVVAGHQVPGNPTGVTWDGQHLWYCDYTNVRLRAVSRVPVALRA